MSHTVQVNLTASQCIYIGGEEVNIHDIQTIFVNEDGAIEEYAPKVPRETERVAEEQYGNLWETHGDSVIIPVEPNERLKSLGLWRRQI